MNTINRALPEVRHELMRIAGHKVAGDTGKTLNVHYTYTNQVIGRHHRIQERFIYVCCGLYEP